MNHTRTIIECCAAMVLVFVASTCSPPKIHIGTAVHTCIAAPHKVCAQ